MINGRAASVVARRQAGCQDDRRISDSKSGPCHLSRRGIEMTNFYKIAVIISTAFTLTILVVLIDARIGGHTASDWIAWLIVAALGVHLVGWIYQMLKD
jgi:hypothetical protein